jgi:ribosomal protein S18 acetylase RimI-like enzyme
MRDEKAINIEIYPISESNIISFHKCLDLVARERIYLGFVEAPQLKDVMKFVLSNITQKIPQYVALDNNEVIGWCDVIPETLTGFTHCGHLGMGVQKDYRRKGIGRKLLLTTINKAKIYGLERIELDVYDSNKPAVNLYKEMGFIIEGIKKKGRKLDGKYDDVLYMALLYNS